LNFIFSLFRENRIAVRFAYGVARRQRFDWEIKLSISPLGYKPITAQKKDHRLAAPCGLRQRSLPALTGRNALFGIEVEKNERKQSAPAWPWISLGLRSGSAAVIWKAFVDSIHCVKVSINKISFLTLRNCTFDLD